MSDGNAPDPLKSLGERLDKARRLQEARAPAATEDKSLLQVALGLGFRIGVELVAALAVGFGIGWFADWGFGRLGLKTAPWGMVLCLILGAAAGILNVFRTMTGQGYAVGYRRPEAGPPARGGRAGDEDED
jgi:ATP synthase protein I